MKSAVIEGVAVGSIKQRSLASSSCLECSQSYGDCVCEETSFQITVAWLHKWSKSDGEALQWAAHEMTFIWGVCSCGGRRVSGGRLGGYGGCLAEVCRSFQMYGRDQINLRKCSARCSVAAVSAFKQPSVDMQNARCYLAEPIVSRRRFSLNSCTPNPPKAKYSPVLFSPHHRRSPLSSDHLFFFFFIFNVGLHVRAIWRITRRLKLQAWLSRKVSSYSSSGLQMLTGLWNAQHTEVWINSCWHHHL